MQPSPYYSLGSIVSFIPQNTLSNKPLIEVNQWILALSCYSQKYLSLPAWSFKQISLLSKCNLVHTTVLNPFFIYPSIHSVKQTSYTSVKMQPNPYYSLRSIFSFIPEYTPSNKPFKEVNQSVLAFSC